VWHALHSPMGGVPVALQTPSAVSSDARVLLRAIDPEMRMPLRNGRGVEADGGAAPEAPEEQPDEAEAEATDSAASEGLALWASLETDEEADDGDEDPDEESSGAATAPEPRLLAAAGGDFRQLDGTGGAGDGSWQGGGKATATVATPRISRSSVSTVPVRRAHEPAHWTSIAWMLNFPTSVRPATYRSSTLLSVARPVLLRYVPGSLGSGRLPAMCAPLTLGK